MKLKTFFLAVAAMGALALSGHAQNASDAQPMIPGMVPGTLPGMVRPSPDATAPDAVALVVIQAPAPPAPGMMAMTPGMMSAQDMLFCVRDAEGNFAEITFATLALNKSKDAGVRQVANTILMGHTKDLNDLMSITRAKGVAMAPKLSASHQVIYDALKKAKGDKFDRMYMAGQVGDHENTIALYQTEIMNGMDDALKAHATQFLPDVVGHTILIYEVARQVKAPGIEMRPMLPPIPPGVVPAIMDKPLDTSSPQALMDSAKMMAPPAPANR